MASYGAGIFMAAALLCCMVQCREAKSIDVGGAAGWTSFESSQVTAPNYGAWAQSQKFSVGDTLVFKFAAGAHNVWLMKSHAAYQSCDFSSATVLDEGNSGYYTWTATQPGAFFFSCDKGAEGVGTHCNYNQKLAIMVFKTATTPISAPSPAPVLPPSPTPVKAPSPAPILPSSPTPVKAPSPAPATLAPSPSPGKTPAPVIAPSPTPVNLAPSPSPLKAPYSSAPVLAPYSSTPVLAPYSSAPVLAPYSSAPVLAPYSSAPVLAPYSSAPVKAPLPAPVNTPSPTPINLAPTPISLAPYSPISVAPSPINLTPPPMNLAPSPSPPSWTVPVAGPAGFPSSAPSPMLSPSSVPAPAPSVASTPMALTPGTVSSSPLPEVPGGGPAADTSPASPNGVGILRSAAQSSSLVHSLLLLYVLLW